MTLEDITSDVGHILFFYLLTGNYQSLRPIGATRNERLANELTTGIGVYNTSRKCELPALQDNARGEIERLAKALPFPLVLNLLRDLNLDSSARHQWLDEYVQWGLQNLFNSPTSFVDENAPQVERNSISFSNVILKGLAGLLANKPASGSATPAPLSLEEALATVEEHVAAQEATTAQEPVSPEQSTTAEEKLPEAEPAAEAEPATKVESAASGEQAAKEEPSPEVEPVRAEEPAPEPEAVPELTSEEKRNSTFEPKTLEPVPESADERAPAPATPEQPQQQPQSQSSPPPQPQPEAKTKETSSTKWRWFGGESKDAPSSPSEVSSIRGSTFTEPTPAPEVESEPVTAYGAFGRKKTNKYKKKGALSIFRTEVGAH